LKNQWGTGWGDKGFFYLARGTNNSFNDNSGICGVLGTINYPVI